jgi:chromosome segregation ATPase
MSRQIEEYERVVTEYKNYDIDGLRRELQDDLNRETSNLNRKQDTHKGETTKKVDGYERLQREHKDLQAENNASHESRKDTLAHIQDENTQFDKFAQDAGQQKAQLRDDLANKEHPLRVLHDQVAVLGLENKNLQLVIDTEAALREAKANAETNAVRTVNTDLKDQVNRIETDILDERTKKNDAKRILDDLTNKHSEAEKAFKQLLVDAEKRRDNVSKDLANLKKTLGDKRSSNDQLRTKVDGNDKNISKFREEINQLNSDIDSLRNKSESDIKGLETERENNERTINEMRNKLAEADHDHSKLKILIEKTRNEIEYLNSEKDKHQSQNYQKRIDDFLSNVTDSEQKSQALNEELSRLNAEWQERLLRTTRETEELIRKNENDDHVKKIESLLADLEKKNQELNDLKNRRNEIEREVSTESSDSKDAKILASRAELDKINQDYLNALEEKNRLYDELVVNTRELLNINETVQRNAHEIAILTQELSILRKELEQKDKIIYDLRIILEQKRQEIEQLRLEIEEKKQLILDLEATLREREDEADRLRALITERDAQIAELERQLAEQNAKPPTPEPIIEEKVEQVIEIEDDVDAMLAQYIQGCPVPIKRLGNGFYMFGTKKIFAKIMNGKLVIRVGGGYMDITEFIKNYADAELIKVNKRREQGLDIFTGKAPVEMNASLKSPKGRKSPKGGKSPKYVAGTDAPMQLTADDIKEYKGQ